MRSRKRSKPAKPVPDSMVNDAGLCECGKRRFVNRREARLIARQRNYRDLNAYRCGGYWHLGHLPAVVERGEVGRDAIH